MQTGTVDRGQHRADGRKEDARVDRRALTRRLGAMGLSAALVAGIPLRTVTQETSAGTPSPSREVPLDPASLSGFAHHTIMANGIRLHYVRGGQGEPLVLLHGFGSTWYMWRDVMPALAEQYDVIVPDLRGGGDSAKPVGGYDKRTMAEDIHALVVGLDLDGVHLAGHDIGLMVAYAYAAQHPDAVRRLALLDAPLPGIPPFDQFQTSFWPFVFHQVRDLPEALITGQENLYLSWFWRTLAYDPTAVEPSAVAEYVRAYSAEGAMRAALEWYRAFAQDAEDNRAFARTPLTMPVLALGGAAVVGDAVYRTAQQVALDVRGGVIEQCGHWIPEERPQEVISQLLAFLGGN